MLFIKKILILQIVGFLALNCLQRCVALKQQHKFIVREAKYTRLCSTKKILTVNRKFPGPTLHLHKGDTVSVVVLNRSKYNITIHWHGVKQPRNPWTDGPAYITQCPIMPGETFKEWIILSEEEGTMWWHAHSDYLRATVYGAIVVYPKERTTYPFPRPHAEVPIILGEWWKMDILDIFRDLYISGGDPNISDAYTINGQPGDLYPCSKKGTFKMFVDYGKTYLLRMVNAAMEDILFFAVAGHQLTVVGTDASYTKPLTRDYITISPGQSLDVLLRANQSPGRYYMAARAYYTGGSNIPFDNTTTTAIVEYNNSGNSSSTPSLPYLPYYNDTNAFLNFTKSLRSLADQDHPISVPLLISTPIISTVSVNTLPCQTNGSCEGPNGTRLASSMNNLSFVDPSIDILEAYYYGIHGVFGTRFPNFPPLVYNFTAEDLPLYLQLPTRATEVKIIDYNSTVEIVLQNTNLVTGVDHPMHLHGYSFYLVGIGLGNFDKDTDPLGYNLIDPPHPNTITVPKNGWATIRFKASNPGVWFMHCHFERHLTWGMKTVFIVKDGVCPDECLLPPPADMPPC